MDDGFGVSVGSVALGLSFGGLDVAVDGLEEASERPVSVDMSMPSVLVNFVSAKQFIGQRSQI